MNITIELPGHFEGLINLDNVTIEKTEKTDRGRPNNVAYKLDINTMTSNHLWVFDTKKARDTVFNDITRLICPPSGLLYCENLDKENKKD